jgi:uridine kinase
MVQEIKERVHVIISENRPIIIEEKQTKEVIRLFGERNSTETTLFQAFGNPYCRYFRMGDFIDYYIGVLMPSTGYLNIFDLELFHDDLLLRIPCRTNPNILEEKCTQDKMFDIFS